MGTMALNILEKNNTAPRSSGWLNLNLNFNQLYVFTLNNFTTETTPPYEDAKGSPFSSLKITSLPSKGLLTNSGSPSTIGDVISSADLTAGNFKYQTDISEQEGYTNGEMEFTVTNSNSGLYSSPPNSVTFQVEGSSNQAPSSIGDGEEDVYVGSILTITRAMLTTSLNPPYQDPEGDIAYKLLVVTTPEYGNLELDGVMVVDGQEILFTDIDLNKLKYINREFPSGEIEGFDFKISDIGSEEYRG